MTYKRIILIVLCTILSIHCSDRERNNPLDPANPDTRGRPTGFTVYSQENEVVLFWDPIAAGDLGGYKLYKSRAGAAYREIAAVGPQVTRYNDLVDEYGVLYEYKMSAVAGAYESRFSESKAVTPGPTYTWIAEPEAGTAQRYSHDLGYRLTLFSQAYSPFRIVADPQQKGGAWVFSKYSGTIYKINSYGNAIAQVQQSMPSIWDMAIDEVFAELWVVRYSAGLVTLISASGRILNSLDTISRPLAVELDSRRHIGWIIDDSSDKVFYVQNMYGRLQIEDEFQLQNPKDIAVDEEAQSVWIADSSRVVKMDYQGREQLILNTPGHADLIACDRTRGNVWIIDRGNAGDYAKLIKYDKQGNRESEHAVFYNPAVIAVNEFNGSCLVSDLSYEHQGIWRCTKDGEITHVVENVVAYDMDIKYTNR